MLCGKHKEELGLSPAATQNALKYTRPSTAQPRDIKYSSIFTSSQPTSRTPLRLL